MQKKTKKRLIYGSCNILASALAVALVSTGTFARLSFDQIAVNETKGEFLVGGRLHTDFDGVSKTSTYRTLQTPQRAGISTPEYD